MYYNPKIQSRLVASVSVRYRCYLDVERFSTLCCEACLRQVPSRLVIFQQCCPFEESSHGPVSLALQSHGITFDSSNLHPVLQLVNPHPLSFLHHLGGSDVPRKERHDCKTKDRLSCDWMPARQHICMDKEG